MGFKFIRGRFGVRFRTHSRSEGPKMCPARWPTESLHQPAESAPSGGQVAQACETRWLPLSDPPRTSSLYKGLGVVYSPNRCLLAVQNHQQGSRRTSRSASIITRAVSPALPPRRARRAMKSSFVTGKAPPITPTWRGQSGHGSRGEGAAAKSVMPRGTTSLGGLRALFRYKFRVYS